MRYRLALLTVLFIVLKLSTGRASQKPDELVTILNRAAEYVARYEDQFFNLQMDENYVQKAAWFGRGSRDVVRRDRDRTIESNYWIFQFENEQGNNERVGIRRVNIVDRLTVKHSEIIMESLLMMDNSPEGMRKVIGLLREASAQYDVGGVRRTVNDPTFGLRVARQTEAARFTFDKRGTDKINGVEAWKVEFHEKRGPTLVHGEPPKRQELKSSGNLWIDPSSGRILKTEFVVENPYSNIVASVIVSYVENKELDMYVPAQMNEHYETEEGYVDCWAVYTKVRPWVVESKSTIDPATPPR